MNASITYGNPEWEEKSGKKNGENICIIGFKFKF